MQFFSSVLLSSFPHQCVSVFKSLFPLHPVHCSCLLHVLPELLLYPVSPWYVFFGFWFELWFLYRSALKINLAFCFSLILPPVWVTAFGSTSHFPHPRDRMNGPRKMDPAVTGHEIIRWYQDFMTNPTSRAQQIAASHHFFHSIPSHALVSAHASAQLPAHASVSNNKVPPPRRQHSYHGLAPCFVALRRSPGLHLHYSAEHQNHACPEPQLQCQWSSWHLPDHPL